MKLIKIYQCQEVVNLVDFNPPPIVGDVVAKVCHGRCKDGGDPEGFNPKIGEVLQ